MWANEFLSSTGRRGNLLLTTRNSVDGAGKETPVAKLEILFEGEESMEIYCMEEKEKEQLLRLIETASLNDAIDYTLYYILQEEAQGYFAGDRTLEETVHRMQRRAVLYVTERM